MKRYEAASLACFLLGAVVGVVVGLAMSKSGADKGLSNLCEGIGNALFPPTVQANILTGSFDTLTNNIPAARAGLDFETAAKLSGTRFVILRGAIARLQLKRIARRIEIARFEQRDVAIRRPQPDRQHDQQGQKNEGGIAHWGSLVVVGREGRSNSPAICRGLRNSAQRRFPDAQ